ncbi:MAG: hypothetical protein IPN04_05710 [Rhodoferax sp.]|nr:hypothetical protein [Rhodoferax sp.]
MFLFFSVARSAQNSQAERAKEALGQIKVANLEVIKDDVDETEITEKMPTDKLGDVSPLALRMSSPFNAGYWLTAA